MKLGKAISVEHIKRMTLRTVRESNEGQPEFIAFMNALERNDFDENLCKREARHLEQVMTTKVRLPCCSNNAPARRRPLVTDAVGGDECGRPSARRRSTARRSTSTSSA
jgi:hypothetical protein